MLFASILLVVPNVESPNPLHTVAADESVAPAVQTPAAPAAPVEPKWTGSVSIGASLTEGDTALRSGSATADAEYRRENDRTKAGFWWNYQEDKNANPRITQRKTGIKLQYDYFFSKRTYGLIQGSAENDFAADIDLRTTIGVGLGRQFFDSEEFIGPGTWKLSAELGATNFDEKHYVAKDDDHIAARAAYNADWKASDKWDFTQTFEAFPSLERGEDILTKLDTRAKVTLTAKMFAQLQWLWTWDNTPAPGTHRNNNLYAITVGWSF